MFALVFIVGLAMGFSITAFSVVPFMFGFLVSCGMQELHPQLVHSAWQRARALFRTWLQRAQKSVAEWRAHQKKASASVASPSVTPLSASPSASSSSTDEEIVEASASPRSVSAPSSSRSPPGENESPVPRAASTPPPSLHRIPDDRHKADNTLLRPTATYAE